MNKLFCSAILAVTLLCNVSASSISNVGKFNTCQNVNGAGLFMINSATGELFMLDNDKKSIISKGKPMGAKSGNVGTYILTINNGGFGVFVSNTTTGETWWTNGDEWNAYGQPNDGKK
jgi:hypothetical protein